MTRAKIVMVMTFYMALALAVTHFPAFAAFPDSPDCRIKWHLPSDTEQTGLCLVLAGSADELVASMPMIVQLQKSGIAVAETSDEIAHEWQRVRGHLLSRGFSPLKTGLFGLSAAAADVLSIAGARGTNELAFAGIHNLPAASCIARGKMCPCIGKGACPMSLFCDSSSKESEGMTIGVYRTLRMLGVPAELHAVDCKQDSEELGTRLLEYIRQMNFDGRLSAKQRIGSRFPNDDKRSSYEKVQVWASGSDPCHDADQCVPYLEWHMPKRLVSKAIMVAFSGGGYSVNSTDGNSVPPVRRFLNEKGFAVVTLKYRTPRPKKDVKYASAWADLQRAIRLVRLGAEQRGLDARHIGLCGGSAGGHLALLGALSSTRKAYEPIDEVDRLPCDVQLAVALFPAYVLSDGLDGPNKNGGNDPDVSIAEEFLFDEKRCPVLFLHGDADGYSSMGSVRMWERLHSLRTSSDVHVFARQPHDFQYESSPGTGGYAYLDFILSFMRKNGF